jgi:hypothetical protein
MSRLAARANLRFIVLSVLQLSYAFAVDNDPQPASGPSIAPMAAPVVAKPTASPSKAEKSSGYDVMEDEDVEQQELED